MSPRPWEAGVEPACVPRDDGRGVTYKGSPVANLCGRILCFLYLPLGLVGFFHPSTAGFWLPRGEGERTRNTFVF